MIPELKLYLKSGDILTAVYNDKDNDKSAKTDFEALLNDMKYRTGNSESESNYV